MNVVELERMELLRLAQSGDRDAQEAFFEKNQGLVRMVVARFQGRGAEYDDLYQVGCVAFVKAVKNFDLNAGVQFSTYAVPVILGELRRHFRDTGAIRVSRGIKEQARSLAALREQLISATGQDPTLAELAAAGGMDASTAAFAMDSLAPVLSLSYTADDGIGTLEDLLGDDPTERMVDRVAVSRAMECLPERERKLILLRFYRSKTQQETAKELGISQVQVSRLERRALQKLREMLA